MNWRTLTALFFVLLVMPSAYAAKKDDPCSEYRKGSAAEVFAHTNPYTRAAICEKLIEFGWQIGVDVVNTYQMIKGYKEVIHLFRGPKGVWLASVCGRIEDLYTYDSFRAGTNLSGLAWDELAGCKYASSSPIKTRWVDGTDRYECKYGRKRPEDSPKLSYTRDNFPCPSELKILPGWQPVTR